MSEESKNPREEEAEFDVFGRKRKRKGGKARTKASEKTNQQNGTPKGDGPSQAEEDGPSMKRPKASDKEEQERYSASSQVLRGINVANFAEARALEISNLMEALKNAESAEGKRVFQRLPRHMRRRAASYDRRRIPRRLRNRAMLEEEKGPPMKKTKMPSRKHRRRPKNLLEEYNRRQRNHAWLETHIWHAKRFKMIEKWGFKLAEHPCNKGFRSTYRASAHGCIMQDISYHGCIEITGSQENILDGLKHHSSKETGAKINTNDVISGRIESTFVFYHYDNFPYNAIGPVSLIWKPVMQKEGTFEKTHPGSECSVAKETELCDLSIERTVLLWCHPSCHDELVTALRKTYEKVIDGKENKQKDATESEKLKSGVLEDVPNTSNDEDQDVKGDIKQLKINSEKYCINGKIRINSWKLDFVKFRLTGPFSHKILVNTLQLHEPTSENEGGNWWIEYYKDSISSESLIESTKAWNILKRVQNAAELPPRAVLGLTVVDPRLNFPLQKTWPLKEMQEQKPDSTDVVAERINLLKDWSPNLCCSPIWSVDIRQNVKSSKPTDAAINKKRSEKLRIGEYLGIEDDSSRIPILLIQRPGVGDTSSTFSIPHYGSGWDVIIPSGWAMAFWVSLVYRGAHVGGQREERSIHLEMKLPHFPKEFPDTTAGRQNTEDERQAKQEEYNRYPPNKRPSYQKFGFEDPFGFPWQSLVIEWHNIHEDILEYSNWLPIQKPDNSEFMTNIQSSDNSDLPNKESEGTENGIEIKKCYNAIDGPSSEQSVSSFYVLRDLTLLRSIKDCLTNRRNSKKSKSKDHSKTFEKQRTLLNSLLEKHSKALLPVSFQCVGKGEVTDNAVIAIPTKEDLEKMNENPDLSDPLEPLHRGLKSSFPAIADSFNIKRSRTQAIGLCTRWTIGYVTSGRYSLSCGRSAGIGFVSVTGLVSCLLMQHSNCKEYLVLLRNNNSQQYRFARIDVITESC